MTSERTSRYHADTSQCQRQRVRGTPAGEMLCDDRFGQWYVTDDTTFISVHLAEPTWHPAPHTVLSLSAA